MKRFASQIISRWERQLARDQQLGIEDPEVCRCLALAKEFDRLSGEGELTGIRRFLETLLEGIERSGDDPTGTECLLSLCWDCVHVVSDMVGFPTSETRSWKHRCLRAGARDIVAYYDRLIERDDYWEAPHAHARELKALLDQADPSPEGLNALADRVDRNRLGSGSIGVRNLAYTAARFFGHKDSAEVGVVTWNMDRRGHSGSHNAAWRWLLEDLQPDIALLQECEPPDWVHDEHTVLFERAYPDSGGQRWGTALVAKGLPITRASLTDVEEWFAQLSPEAASECPAARFRGWCVSAEIDLPRCGPVLFVSVHNPAQPIKGKYLKEIDTSEIKLEHQKEDVWLLDVLFYFLKRCLARPLVVGGDFNYSRLLDEPTPTGNAEFFDRIREEGFVSLHRPFHDSDEQTHFKPGARPHQLDYLYADESIARRVTDCHVVPYEEVWEFSDHAPLVAHIAT